MNRRLYVPGAVDQRALEVDGTGPIPFIAATEGRKADGIDLRMDAADLSRYAANPVVMYGHQYYGRESLPIGRAETKIDGKRLLADVQFDLDDPFAATCDRKVRNMFLNAVSIGFEAHDIGQDGVPERWELFEISLVPLPLDPDAVTDLSDGRELAIARMLGLGGMLDGRAGKVLSAKNLKLVEDAITALTALKEAASKADEEDSANDDGGSGDEDRSGAPDSRMSIAERRLQLVELTAH